MIDRATFVGGLGVMALQLNKPAERELLDAYHLALADETSPEEWGAFFPVAVKRFGWKFLPTVPELLDALREFRGQPNLDAEAIAAYERVIAAGVYSAEGGTSWHFRTVVETCGRAAAEAFLEAGGHNAFANTFRESDRRERFVAAYRVAAREDDSARLLPPASVGLLQGDVESAPFEHDEAAAILEKVSGVHAGEERKPFTKPPVVVEATEDRLAALRRQAEEIQAAPAAVEV